jgi:hypothetical protein
MHATLTTFGFLGNLCQGAPLWVLLFCCLAIKRFKLDETTGVSNGKNFRRIYCPTSHNESEPMHEDLPSDITDRTIERIQNLVLIVDHVVASTTRLKKKDVSPLLPLEYYFEKEKVIQSIWIQFEQRLQQNDAANRWICCKQDNFCFLLKICKGLIDTANVHCINITDHKWFESRFKNSLLFLGTLLQPVRKAAKKLHLGFGSDSSRDPRVLQEDDDDDNDRLDFDLYPSEESQFQALNRKELLGIKPATHWTTLFCIRQLKLEQDNLWRSIESQRKYVRKIEESVFKDISTHKLYFEYLSASPTPAPKFSSPASVDALTAIAMSLTTATAMFPFPEGSVLANLSPDQEKNVLPSRTSSKLSIGFGRAKCNHCHMILVADSISKHMRRKHPCILSKEKLAARVVAKHMPKQFRNAFSKVRNDHHQPPRYFCCHRHPHFVFPVAARSAQIFK